MNNQAFSKIWILFIIIFIGVGILAWQYFGRSAGIPVSVKEAFKNFMENRIKGEPGLYSYLPNYAKTVELKVATVLTSFSKIILTSPNLKQYEVVEAKGLNPGKFQFGVKSYFVKEGKKLGYYEEEIVMEKSGNNYLVTSFKQSEYKSLTKEDPCRNLSDEPKVYGKYEFPSEKDFCYWTLAEERKDLSFCNKIDDKLSKNECYAELGVITEDPNVCETFKGDLWFTSKCYTGLAVKTKDSTMCDKIQDKKAKEGCLTEVEYSIKKEKLGEEFKTKKEKLEEKYKGYKIEPVSTIPGWKTYKNLEYGYEIQYPKDFKESSDRTSVTFSLPLEAGSVSIRVDKQPAVLLSGTYGGWYPFKEDSEQPNRIFSHEMHLGNILFEREYWIVYGGMGSWDNVINCYTKYKDNYYIISLEHMFIGGTPGMVSGEGEKLTKEEIIEKALDKMLDEENEYVKMFNQMLSTFKFIEVGEWKTYKNEQFGYSIEYPNDWNAAGLFGGHEDLGMVFGKKFSKDDVTYSCSLSIVYNGSEEHINSLISEGWVKSIENIGGVSAIKASDPEFPVQAYYYLEPNSFEIHHLITKTKGGKDVNYTSDPEIEPICRGIFEKMLSAFKFLK